MRSTFGPSGGHGSRTVGRCPGRRGPAAWLAALLTALLTALPLIAVWPGGTIAAAAPAAAKDEVTLQSASAVVMEAGSGKLILAHNPHQRLHPASVTKIMTLIVALDAIKQGRVQSTDTVTVSTAAAGLGGTTAFLDTGETVTLAHLLKAIAVGSANDASVAVAEHIAGSHEAFVTMMNAKARDLGLANTQFQNATGFDADGHYTSAHDVAVMSRYAIATHPSLLALTRIFLDSMPHPDGRSPTELLNRNKLVRFYTGADGLKTGWTQAAGYSISATAERQGTRIIAVILGAPSAQVRQEEAWKLLDYGFARYVSVSLGDVDKAFGQVAVVQGRRPTVAAVPERRFVVAVPKGDQKKVRVEVQLLPEVRAPLEKGQVIGRVRALAGSEPLGEIRLVAAVAVERLGLWGSIRRALGHAFSLRHLP